MNENNRKFIISIMLIFIAFLSIASVFLNSSKSAVIKNNSAIASSLKEKEEREAAYRKENENSGKEILDDLKDYLNLSSRLKYEMKNLWEIIRSEAGKYEIKKAALDAIDYDVVYLKGSIADCLNQEEYKFIKYYSYMDKPSIEKSIIKEIFIFDSKNFKNDMITYLGDTVNFKEGNLTFDKDIVESKKVYDINNVIVISYTVNLSKLKEGEVVNVSSPKGKFKILVEGDKRYE